MAHLDQPVTEEDVERVFQAILHRPVNNDDWKRRVVGSGVRCGDFVASVRNLPEMAAKVMRAAGVTPPSPDRVPDARFRLPDHLRVTRPGPPRFLLIGSCLMDRWPAFIAAGMPGVSIERIVFNNASPLPPLGAAEARGYDFQILQLPLRSILPEAALMSMRAGDVAGYEALFERACHLLRVNLEALAAYNRQHGIPSYLLGFHTPLQNPLGRAQKRYCLSNAVYFIEQLNRRLHEEAARYANMTVIDTDAIAATFGKRYFGDDFLAHLSHGSVITGLAMPGDEARLEPVGKVEDLYAPDVARVVLEIFREVMALRRAEAATDAVKLVILDLDDTLWRGVAAEADDPGPELTEGWPLGILEAVSYLWRRGVLLAIVSRNEEAVARALWDRLYGKRFPMENFVALRINRAPKAENVAAILAEVNLLPESVLFVDDNPQERAAVRQAFPGLRAIDAPLAEWRRILLWAPELQRAVITEEAAARGEMVKAQIAREAVRAGMGHEDFLASLGVAILPHLVREAADPRFARCVELLNKTNQFNTTGRRWEAAELGALLAEGGFLIALEVSDRFTRYGITGLAVVRGDTVEQFVLSCRVFGMGIEQAAMAIAQGRIEGPMRGLVRPTERNRLSLGLYEALGFQAGPDGTWLGPDRALELPPHVSLVPA
ncbi:HAD-IIIC family phosphatase [Roseomonas nepalensis]|uniref:HAD-IIIC family phosphatase n=1 Tax=Muricoccus nepalensis TaxID=1854500 RepID=A0A502FVN8_9PROT|nr:HAD-IIIC family phosphatase [Roseomonas nepalensis]TPG53501.1 HAD-IIIC family phosphatase [Roseomonas nepalensis]